MQEYIDMWKNFANFEGRTSVRGYWMAFLINFLLMLVLGVAVAVIEPLAYLVWLYELALIVPMLSIQVRRLRDSGHRWFCIFLPFIPLVGTIILLVFLVQRSKYDPDDSFGAYGSSGYSI